MTRIGPSLFCEFHHLESYTWVTWRTPNWNCTQWYCCCRSSYSCRTSKCTHTQHPVGQSSVNENHYEPTTIPSSFMPILAGSSALAAAPFSQDQDGGSRAIRSSARVRTPKQPHDVWPRCFLASHHLVFTLRLRYWYSSTHQGHSVLQDFFRPCHLHYQILAGSSRLWELLTVVTLQGRKYTGKVKLVKLVGC